MKCSHGYTRTSEFCPTCDNRGRVLPLEIELAQLRAEVVELNGALGRKCLENATLVTEVAELRKDKERLDTLEELSRGFTGVTLQYVKYVEDNQVLEKGYRVLTFHKLRTPYSTLREAIDAARAKEKDHG